MPIKNAPTSIFFGIIPYIPVTGSLNKSMWGGTAVKQKYIAPNKNTKPNANGKITLTSLYPVVSLKLNSCARHIHTNTLKMSSHKILQPIIEEYR